MTEHIIKRIEDDLREIQIWKQSITSDLAMIGKRSAEALKDIELLRVDMRKEDNDESI